MRLLFIYFYETKGTFKEGTIISLSKKYTVSKLDKDFEFKLKKNNLFQDDFYGSNIDIGAVIGENGTGKSILINSLRDKKNNYSFVIYEESKRFFYSEELDKKVIINNEEIQHLLNISYIYYSPIIDMFFNNNSKEYNISDKQLLLKNDNISLSNRLAIIENNDINYYF
ncbi:MAG TPA: hypothetical protein ENK66_01210, partial [Arcobacter sp.]|nr:hypothetical protein [Arcobacter sp.]